METRVEVWENEKLKWEHEPVVCTQFRVLFHECFYNVWEHTKNVFYFFYKTTRIENLNVEIVFFIKA